MTGRPFSAQAEIKKIEEFAKALINSNEPNKQVGGRILLKVMPIVYKTFCDEFSKESDDFTDEEQSDFDRALNVAAANLAANVIIFGSGHIQCPCCKERQYQKALEIVMQLLKKNAHVEYALAEVEKLKENGGLHS